MQFNIKQFVVFIVLFLLTVLYVIFSDYYADQREQTASAILSNLREDMSEIGYILSKNLHKQEDIKGHRAVLDRTAANNDFISAIMVLNGSQLLLTTDPAFLQVPKGNLFFRAHEQTPYEVMRRAGSFEGVIRYYRNGELHRLRLVFVVDKGEVKTYLNYNKAKFLVYLVVLPSILVFFVWGLFSVYVSQPLEKLKNYLLTGEGAPKPFKLKELDTIRGIMEQTFARLAQEQRHLYKLARKDSLTGLANRNALHERLEKIIEESKTKERQFAFLFLDLDLFKSVNDSLGHHIGDELLKQVGKLLKRTVHRNEFVARVGGDEFILLLHRYSNVSEIIATIETIQRELSEPFHIHNHPISISSSVGVAFYPQDGQDFVGLMQCSDIAMYEAKKNGRSQYFFYTEQLNQQVQKTIKLEKEMQLALDNDEYQLFYQPKVDLISKEIIGAEALIRWVKPDGTLVPPSEFISLAEENGFIMDLGKWILEEALNQLHEWQQKGIQIRMSINVAARQFLSGDFEADFKALLVKIPVDPKFIDLEITEYLFFEQNKSNSHILQSMRDLGVTISLDDFGTGFSSLSYLKKFPIDFLKIDKSFVDDYDTEQGAVFLETIVKMAKSLRMGVVAEGVETETQVKYLEAIGCDTFQGYICSRPLPVEDFYRFLGVNHQNTCITQKVGKL
ncbi:MAG: EAL domain-containing protein [Thiotrichales bacterium]|nr:EAL domain-containing protein [Thiotrichales bacterium]